MTKRARHVKSFRCAYNHHLRTAVGASLSTGNNLLHSARHSPVMERKNVRNRIARGRFQGRRPEEMNDMPDVRGDRSGVRSYMQRLTKVERVLPLQGASFRTREAIFHPSNLTRPPRSMEAELSPHKCAAAILARRAIVPALSAMLAAIVGSVRLDAMTDDATPAFSAAWSQS